MKKFKYILIILMVVFANQSLYGAIERFSNRLEGPALTAGSTLSVYDDKYYDMSTDPFWVSRFANKQATGTVRIGINPDITSIPDFSTFQLIEITYWTWNPASASFVAATPIIKPFSLSYSSSGLDPEDNQATFVIPGAQRISVRVLNGTLPLDKLFLETSIEVERYYILNDFPVVNLKHTPLNVAGDGPQIEFSWDTKSGAEFYELEWVHINDYKMDPQDVNDYLDANTLKYDFYLNSTRIDTKQNWYKIPRVFDHGYIIYRVRAIGKNGVNFTTRQEGVWTAGESGVVSSFPSANRIFIEDKFSTLNWAHSVVYAEDGKRFEGISYADGLGRGHQSVAHNPVTNQAIVSNVYYDELGRAAVSDLPTPVPGASMKFQAAFNLVDSINIPYSRNNFDGTLVDSCFANSGGFSTTSGAGKYYSPSNPDQNGANAAIPDAEKYPFSRVTFMNDYSNRVSSVSAAGKDLKAGSGKETKIFYPSTNQTELNQLFGTEVGWAPHYQKMITVDPNGQIYVQYLDMAGRTVLSYMEGPSPDNVDGVDGNSSTDLNVVMIENGAPQSTNTMVPYSEISYSQYVSTDTVFNFNYSFTPEQFQSACTGTLCLDCIYDLEIEVYDYCGAPVTLNGYTNPVHIIGSDIDDLINGTCNGTNVHEETFSAHLNKGMYTIHKKLTVDPDAIDAYWCLYFEANTCIEEVQSIFNEAYEAESFAACNPTIIDDEPESTCDSYKQIMLTDVSPGGQYGTYNKTSWTSGDAYSVFNPSGALGVNWRTLTYLDENNVAVPASYLAGPEGLKWFVTNFREEWAEVLVREHPEYCYLEFCYMNESSNKYDKEMLAINSYETALSEGYIKPLPGGVPNLYYTFFPSPASSIPSNPDPFFMPDSLGASYSAAMLAEMNLYMLNVNDVANLSMWEYAVYLLSGQDCRKHNMSTCLNFDDCNKDLVWLAFRNLYLAEKHTRVFLAQQAYAEANGCSNKCIGAVGSVAGCNSAPQSALKTRSPRFGNKEAFSFDVDNITSLQAAYGVINPMIAESCSTSCEGYAEQWLQDLAGCAPINSLDSIQRKALKDEFIELCMLGCDSVHPMGATTAPPGEHTQNGNIDIRTVLTEHLGGHAGYPDPACSDYLITFPGPYKKSEDMPEAFPKLDQCGCDVLMEVRTDYQAGIANGTILTGTSIETYLNVYKGIDMDDIDNLLCVCDQFYDETNNQWLPNANANIVAAKKLVPTELTCVENTSCKSCDEVNSAYTAAYNFASITYGLDPAAFEATSNYETILTNFLNGQLGYDLKFKDYDFFHRGCNTTSSNPVCELNPVMDEFKKILTVQAMRGKLVQATTLNLANENIVYRHGELYEKQLLGSSYKGTVNGGHLTLSFQDGSQTPCTFDLSVAEIPDFDFSKIVSFGEMWATSTNCTANSNFELEVKYYQCGQLVTALAQVTNTCLQVNLCYCGDNGQRLCNEPLFDPDFEICYQPVLDNMMHDATKEYEESVTEAYHAFQAAYKAKCAKAFSTENFTMKGKYRYYQYTQFYYDQAGNLVRTVAPKGIGKTPPSQDGAINTSRENVGTPITPAQSFETKYRYNSYNQLVSTTNPDQEGATKFWYDFYGRIALSQNPVQQQTNKYSYTFYDKQGRPEEVGQVIPGTAFNETTLLKVQDPVSTVFKAWITASGSARTEVTRTYYDSIFMQSQALQNRFTLQPGQTQPGQQNLRLRVASVAYYNTVTSTTDFRTQYASATHYTYDLHGNVLQTLQDVPELAPVKQDIKSTEYEFELLSGNVKTVKYQKDKLDQLTHTYIYDRANRLEEVFVSTDKIHQSRQAHYLYYDYGPLARVELGEQKVQGMDYAYTINGWMKAMNGTVLNPGYELGRDNASGYLSQNTSVHNKFARDVVGYTLGYFNGDYKSIGSTNFVPSPYNEAILNTAISQLYNGNIAYTTTAIADVPGSLIQMGIQMGVYRYDQMNRLVGARTFRASGLAASNSWAGAAETQEYKSTYSYDANGNLTHLQRNGGATNLNMDKFEYRFDSVPNTLPATGNHLSNRLDYVDDVVSYNGNYPDDIDDQNPDNYGYDKLGQLIRDNSEGLMTIEWFSGNRKVKKITRSGKTIEFKYNPFGQRLLKTVTNTSTGAVTTSYYAYDANGQVMGVYEVNLTTNKATLNELNIYGASRLGMIDRDIDLVLSGVEQPAPVYPPVNPAIHTLGYKKYEITNYLGNVNAVITDRKLVAGGTYEAVVIMNSDYYPFGMPMPERNTDIYKYRFGYNGMELDNEVKGDGNSYTTEFRQYDPRLGRWLSLDPLMAKFPWMSPYVAFDDNPIKFVDPNGLKAQDWVARETTDKNGVVHKKWKWDPRVNSQAEATALGYKHWMGKGGVVQEMHTPSGYVGPVTLQDGGKYVEGNIPEETAEEGMRGKLEQAQIDATFNPEKEIVYGTPAEGLEASWNEREERAAEVRKINENLDNFNRGMDNLTLGMFAAGASPFVAGGIIVYGGGVLSSTYTGIKFVATSYHYTFGINGGYVSMASNVINQTSSLLSEKNGKFGLGDLDLISLGSSAFVTNQTSLFGQMIQGASGTYLSYTVNGGFDGALIKKKSGTYIFASTVNGILNPLMNKSPLISPLGNEVLTGGAQGTLNKIESE